MSNIRKSVSRLTIFVHIACLLCISLPFTGCNRKDGTEPQTPAETHQAAAAGYDMATSEHADRIRTATNIITADYLETVETFRGNEYVYEVREELKGSADGAKLYIMTVEYVDVSKAMPIPGNNIILFLSKYSSVYYEHDSYILIDIADDTESERTAIRELSSENETPAEKSGHTFTRSADIADIVAATESVFLVMPKEVYVVGATAPTITYTCTVQAAIQGQPEFSEILITFFQDTVTIGEEYLVLLADHRKGGRIYTLSSPYSVFSTESARQIPELKALLEQAQEVTAPNLPTDAETYAAEQSFHADHS